MRMESKEKELQAMLSGEQDPCSCFLEVHIRISVFTFCSKNLFCRLRLFSIAIHFSFVLHALAITYIYIYIC